MKKATLIKVATELNKVCGLDPEIDVKLPVKELSGFVEEAATLLEPEDELSKATIKALKDEGWWPFEEEGAEEAKKAEKSEAKKENKKPSTKKESVKGKWTPKGAGTKIYYAEMEKGGKWEDILERVNDQLAEIGQKQLTVGGLKSFHKWVLERDPDWLKGRVKENEIAKAKK